MVCAGYVKMNNDIKLNLYVFIMFLVIVSVFIYLTKIEDKCFSSCLADEINLMCSPIKYGDTCVSDRFEEAERVCNKQCINFN